MASGIYGLVNNGTSAFSTVEQWTINDTKTSDSYSASNTYNGVVRGGGIRMWDGSFQGRGVVPPVMPGEGFLFEGYTEPTSGTEGDTGITYTGTAIVNSITMTWDWTANTVFQWVVNFNGLPPLSIATGVPELDVTIPSIGTPCTTHWEYESDTPETYLEIPALTTATLTITSALAAQANSDTAALGGECYMSYKKGPIDWTLALNQEDYERGVDGYPDLGDYLKLRGYVNNTDFYQMNFGRQESYTNLVVDRNGGTTIARTLNIAMSATDGTTVGQIVLPGGDPASPWWGLAITP